MTPSQYNAHCFCMFLSCWNLPKTDWIVWWLLICSSFLWKMVMPDSWLLITILIIQKTSQFFGVNEETSPKNHPAKNLLFSQLGHVPSLKLTARTWNGDDPSRTPCPSTPHVRGVAAALPPGVEAGAGPGGAAGAAECTGLLGKSKSTSWAKEVFNAQYSTGRLRSRDNWNDHFPRMIPKDDQGFRGCHLFQGIQNHF